MAPSRREQSAVELPEGRVSAEDPIIYIRGKADRKVRRSGKMAQIVEECECVVCGNEAEMVIDCKLVDVSDPDNIKVLPKDRDVQVMPGV